MGLNLSHIGTYQAGSSPAKNFVQFDLIRQGRDLVVLIGGGESHIGSLAVSDKKVNEKPFQYTLKNHREDQIVRRVAERVSAVVKCEVAVIGGIHYDGISGEQIQQIVRNVELLLEQMIIDLTSR